MRLPTVRDGSDRSVGRALEAAEQLQQQYGLSTEVIDARFLNPLNYEPIGSTPVQLAGTIEADIAKWRRIVRETNYKPEE